MELGAKVGEGEEEERKALVSLFGPCSNFGFIEAALKCVPTVYNLATDLYQRSLK